MSAFNPLSSRLFRAMAVSTALFAANCSGKTYSTFLQPFDIVFGKANSNVSVSLQAATPLTNTRVMLTFSKPVTLTSSQTIANYSITDANGNQLHLLAVSRDPNNSAIVFVDTTPQTSGTTYTVTASNLVGVDGATLARGSATFTAPTNADQSGPQFSSVSATNATTVVVYFNEAVDQTTAQTAGSYTIRQTSCAGASIAVTTAVRDSSNFSKVTLTTASGMTSGTTYYVCGSTSIQDIWGNTNASTIQSSAFVYSAPAPKVSSAVLSGSGSAATLLVTYDQAMSTGGNITTLARYGISGCTGSGTVSAPSAATMIGTTQVQLTGITLGGTGSGSCLLTVTTTGISSALGATLSGTNNTAYFPYSLTDTTSPAILSIVPTNTNTLTVTFTEPVSAGSVNTGSFTFSPSLNVTAVNCTGTVCTLTTADQSTTTYTATASGVQDSSGNTIGSASTTFTGDGRPYIVGIFPDDPTTIYVQWSEPLAGTALSDYAISGVTIASAALYPSSPSAMVKLTLTAPGTTSGTSYTLTLPTTAGTTDSSGNTGSTTIPSGGSFTGPSTTTAPQISSASSTGPTVVIVNFNEPLNNATVASNGSDFALSGVGCPTVVGSATQIAAGVVQLTVTATSPASAATCTVTVAAGNVADLAGNTIGATNNSATYSYTGNNAGTPDTTAPTIGSIIALSNTQVRVYFSEPVATGGGANAGDNTANYSFSPALTGGVASATCSATYCTLTLNAPGTSAQQYSLTISNIQDTATPANTMATATASFSGIGSSVAAPTVYMASLVNSTTVEVTFSEMMSLADTECGAGSSQTGVTCSTLYTLTGGNSVSTALLQGDATKVRLTFSPGAYGSSNTYTVTGTTSVKDAAGNALGTPNSATFSGSATSPSATTLAAASDTGTLGDNITSAAFPSPGLQFTGTVAANTTVYLYDDGVLVATAVSNSSGAYTLQLTSNATVGQGTNVFTVATVGPTGLVSDASPALSITYDSTSPAAPGSLTLVTGSDSGVSNSDRITNSTTPSFTVTCENGASVQLRDNTTNTGTAVTCSSGTATLVAGTLTAGVHATMNAIQTDVAGNTSVASSNLSVTIDTTAATLNTSTLAANNLTLTLTFAEGVYNSATAAGNIVLADGAFTLNFNQNGGAATAASITNITHTAGSATVTLTIGITGTPNGSELITVDSVANKIFDVAGNASTVSTGAKALNAAGYANITGATLAGNNAYIDVTFSEAAWTAALMSGGLSASDFTVTFSGSSSLTAAAISSVKKNDNAVEGSASATTGGETTVRVFLTLTGTPAGTETIRLNAANNAIFSATDNATSTAQNTGTLTFNDKLGPTVTNVTSATTDGTYKSGDTVSIQVTFSEVVTVTGTPQLTLETGATDAVVNYASGTGTNTLTFTYTVASGHISTDLDYANTTALTAGTSIRDAANNNATLTLPVPGAAGSLGANKAIVIDAVAPTVTSVNSSTSNGSYKSGQSISIQVNFSENVTVTGTPQLTLETGTTDAVVNYASGSGTSQLTFTYTIAAGHNSSDLDYQSTGALALNGGTINDAAGNAATLTLASPGAANSLGNNKAIVVDTTAPTVSGVTSSTGNGTYKTGQSISIQVNFSESVTVTGTPQLTLETGTSDAVVNYASGSPGTSLTFTYTISAGESSSDLDYISNAALALNSGTILDAAGNAATLTLASPGAANSLGANKALVVDGIAPTVTSVTSSTADGSYGVGQNISIQVTFSESVTVTGTPQLTLETGTTDAVVNYASGSPGTTLTFTYTIASGHTSSDLDYQSTSALALNGGTINDTAGNAATLTLFTPGSANSLGANKSIVIDSAVPTISSAEALDMNKNGKIDSYRVTFSENVKDSSFPGYVANNFGTATTDWAVAGYSNVRLIHGTQVSTTSSATYTDTADDNVIFIAFNESAGLCSTAGQAGCDTGAKPDLTMSVAGLTDSASNQLATFAAGGVTEADSARPIVIASSVPSNTTVRVIFTETVTASTAECGAGSSQSGVNCNTRYTITGGSGLSVTSAIMLGGSGVNGTTVVLTTATQTASQAYTITVTTGVVQDTATNTNISPYNTITFTGASPAVTLSSASATNNTTVSAVFNQNITATTAECSGAVACAAKWTISGLTITNAVMAGGAGVNGTTVTLTTSSQTSSTTNGYTLTATTGVISDAATGTVFCTTGNNTATFTGDVLPTVVSAVSVNATTVDVTFSEAVQWDSLANGALLNTNYSISPSLGTITAAAQTVATVVRLTTSSSQTASTSYTLTVTNVKDQTGNTISGSNTANFTGLEEIKILSAQKVTDSSGSFDVFSVTFSKAFKVDGGNNAVNNLANWSFPSGLNTVTLCTSADDSACPSGYTAGTSTTVFFKSTPAPSLGAYTVVGATAVGSPSGALGCILNDGGTAPGNCLQVNPNDRATVNFGLPSDIEAGPVYTDPFNDGVTLSGQVLQYNGKLIIGPNNYDSGLFQTDLSLLNSSSITLDADGVTSGSQPFGRRSITGLITATTGSTAVTGSGTAFTSEVKVGQYLFTGTTSTPTRIGRVASITNDTSLTLAANGASAPTNQAAYVGVFESCSGGGTIPDCTGADSRVLAGVDYMYAGCYDNSSPYASTTLSGSACTSAGGTEYLFIVGFNTVANSNGYQSNWNSTSTTSPFVFNNHVVGLSNFADRTFRAMSAIIFKGWVYQASQHQAGTAAVRWNRFTPDGTTVVDLSGQRLNKIGEGGTINNGQGASATGLISIDTMHEHDNDGASANESQLYIANGGSCGINGAPDAACLGNARTANTRSDGGVLRTVLGVSGSTPPTACSGTADCDTKWEDVTPAHAKWLAYMSKALPQDARGDGTCGSPFVGTTDDWDCLVPGNTILPNIKAIPKMVNFNGDLYMIRNACSTQTVQTLTTTAKSTCPSGNEKPQLWRLNSGAGDTAANARSNWTLVAENGSTGRTDMTGAEWLGGTSQSTKTANNTEITLLLVNGTRLYVGFDNGTNGANVWRTKSGVTRAANESDFEAVCETGHACSTASKQFGWANSVTKIFDSLSVNDAGTDYVIITARTGVVPMQIYRQSNN